MRKISLLIPWIMAGVASAQEYFTNDSMTEGYRRYWEGDYWHAWLWPYEQAMGDWIYAFAIFIPAASLWIDQRSMHISAIWILCGLAAYGYHLTTLPPYYFYLFVVAWVALGLIKMLSLKYHS